jgi:hypothetical protein
MKNNHLKVVRNRNYRNETFSALDSPSGVSYKTSRKTEFKSISQKTSPRGFESLNPKSM